LPHTLSGRAPSIAGWQQELPTTGHNTARFTSGRAGPACCGRRALRALRVLRASRTTNVQSVHLARPPPSQARCPGEGSLIGTSQSATYGLDTVSHCGCMTAELVLALTAAALTACCTAPQFVRALSTTEGLSLSAWLQGFSLGMIWASYGAATRTWVLFASEGLFALGSLAVVSRLAPPLRTALYASAGLLLIGVAFTALGPSVCLVLASIASLAARLSQISTAWRSGTAAGVSVLAWAVLAASNFSWMGVGLLRRDVVFAVSAGVGGLASLGVIATCLALSRRGGLVR